MISEATTQMLTLDEVAARLKVALRSVQQFVYDKDLGSFHKGERRRVSELQLVEFVLINTVNPKRPHWLTPRLESEFVEKMKDLIRQVQNERMAA
jgi:hypothetical protein